MALYDSINPSLAIEALDCALRQCRPQWSHEYLNWLKELVKHTICNNKFMYKGNWYLATKGIPTGGVLSPLLANITMTYVLNNVLFNKEDDVNANPRGFQGIMRFIDDLGGRWVGPTEPFHKWVQWLNGCTKPKYGIEFTSRIGNEVEFLDILISFDPLGNPITDLFVKPTDARRYLSPESCHPGHTFNSVVYSQGIRLRRIISNNEELLLRLYELADAFIISGYNRESVTRILNKIASKPRVLSYNKRNQENKNIVPWIITYRPGAKQTREFVLQGSKILDKSPIWRDLGARVMICTRRASNLRDLLYKRKAISLSILGDTIPCGVKRCLSSILINPINTVNSTTTGNAFRINCKSSCTSRCLVYMAECIFCKKQYVGNTTQKLRDCITGNRNSKESALKIHLDSHNSTFNQTFKFVVLSHSSPEKLNELESIWISKLRTSEPDGLNRVDPCALRTGVT